MAKQHEFGSIFDQDVFDSGLDQDENGSDDTDKQFENLDNEHETPKLNVYSRMAADQGDYDESDSENEGISSTANVPMRSYMRVVNKLQNLCRILEKDGIALPIPRIVVVGSQTTGKTSLLEQIAEEKFLPRGQGTVTKCPIELRFMNSATKKFKVGDKEYSTNASVEKAIERKSIELSDRDGGISSETIIVEIYSPKVPDMTLVDLPGLIEISAAANQDQDLPQRIESMVLDYIGNDKTIILAVASANDDFQNSKCIKLAKIVDPEGNRTLAVITKLDKLDANDDEDVQLLKNNLQQGRAQVKLGIISVVNRTKNDSFDDAKVKETCELQKHFSQTQAQKHGINYLGNRLSWIQMHHIQDSLHEIMRELERNIRAQDQIIEELGCGEVVDKRVTLKQVAMRFANEFKSEAEGANRNINCHTLSGGVSIKKILDHDLSQNLNMLDPLQDLSNAQMVNAICNGRGIDGINHLTELAFEMIVRDQIMKMEPACLNSLEAVYVIMRDDMPKNCFPFRQGHRSGLYPPLQQEIQKEIRKLLDAPNEEVKKKIKDYISTQAYTPRTNNPMFLHEWDGTERTALGLVSPDEVRYLINLHGSDHSSPTINLNADPAEPVNLGSQQASTADDQDLHDRVTKKLSFLRMLVEEYFKIVKAQVVDHVAKIIKKHLIFYTTEQIHIAMTDFYTAALNRRREGNLIREGDEVIERRRGAQDKKKIMEDALQGFREVKDIIQSGTASDAENYDYK